MVSDQIQKLGPQEKPPVPQGSANKGPSQCLPNSYCNFPSPPTLKGNQSGSPWRPEQCSQYSALGGPSGEGETGCNHYCLIACNPEHFTLPVTPLASPSPLGNKALWVPASLGQDPFDPR